MQFLHLMLRVMDLEESLEFFAIFDFKEVRRIPVASDRFSLVFLRHPSTNVEIELTHNWDQIEPYEIGNYFGHIAFAVDNIYDTCRRCEAFGAAIVRPPRDGYMAFIKSPDGISIELLQKGQPLPPEQYWLQMPNQGTW